MSVIQYQTWNETGKCNRLGRNKSTEIDPELTQMLELAEGKQ